MIKINVSPKAIADIEQIKKYITEELSSKDAATKLLGDIYHQIERLQDFPLMGAPLFGKVEVQNDYRFLVSGNYMVFYRFEVDTVYIVRVLFGKSDYMRILFEEQLS